MTWPVPDFRQRYVFIGKVNVSSSRNMKETTVTVSCDLKEFTNFDNWGCFQIPK